MFLRKLSFETVFILVFLGIFHAVFPTYARICLAVYLPVNTDISQGRIL